VKRKRLSPEARQEHLLDCSAKIITMESVAYFTMEGLAKYAGVSAPLIYNYFPNRIVLLQTLLKREYGRFSDRTFEAAKEANTFEDIVRISVKSNFEHYAPGSVLPMLITQPEIASIISDELARNARLSAAYLINKMAEHYQLDEHRAGLIVQLSSGAAWSAAEWSSKGGLSREDSIEIAVAYVLAGIEHLTRVHSD
jgi:TetR/AcrR family transcriptional regulator, fatty acid biosynthesis regulator